MKSIVVSALLLVGFSASASVCKVSADTVERIESIKESSMMAKPKFTTIKALVATDACVTKYLKEGDAANLARQIISLKFFPVEQILNFYVETEEEKLSLLAPKACEASAQTLEEMEELRSSKMHVKIRYVSMKGLLAEDECLASELNQSQVTELAQRIVFEATNYFSAEAMINQALAK